MAKSFNARMRDRFQRITTNIQKQNTYIHETGMMLLRHAHEHGNCDLAAAFVRSLPASMRRQMLIDWMAKYSPIVVKLGDNEGNDKKGFSVKYKSASGDDKAAFWNIDGADEEPFYLMAETTPEIKTYTLAQLIKMAGALGERIEKIANNENDRAKIEDKDRKAALDFAGKVKALAA